ncbi:hypothetical protein PMAC_003012 [Pneumocystis sp. 'macacae']|nr:hypothetical protein PMAC_003012 [Pneumocystis sp. 'macacae']
MCTRLNKCVKNEERGGSVQSRGWGEEGGSDVKKKKNRKRKIEEQNSGGRGDGGEVGEGGGVVEVEIRTGGVKNKNNRTEEIEVELD